MFSHVVQYQAPLFMRYARRPELDVTVAFCSMQGAEPGHDAGFGTNVAWDIPLLDGYRWEHPPNRSPRPTVDGFFGLLNPGLWHLVRRGGFDVVVCYGYWAVSFWIAALAARSSGATLVFASDAPTVERPGMSPLKLWLKRTLVPRIFRFADAGFGASTPAVRNLQRLGLAPERTFLAPLVVDVERFAAGGNRRVLRERLGIGDDEPCVTFVGKLIDRKHPLDVVAAVARVEGLHLIIAGDGARREEVESRGRALAPGRIHIVGFCNQAGLPDVYAAGDAHVVASDYDPFPAVVIEAMASARPVVASDAIGSVGDLVVHDDTGLVYPCGDADALTDCLRRVATDPAGRERLGEAARRRALAWSPDFQVDCFSRACRSLAGRAV